MGSEVDSVSRFCDITNVAAKRSLILQPTRRGFFAWQPRRGVWVFIDGCQMIKKEQWKPCCRGYYEASDLGRIRRARPARGTSVGYILKSGTRSGYLFIIASINGETSCKTVHRLVTEAFLGKCPPGRQVNHIDGIKTNNTLSNLEYVTPRENMLHSYRIGLQPRRDIYPQSTIDQARRLRGRGLSYRDISRETGMSFQHCWSVVNGTRRANDSTS